MDIVSSVKSVLQNAYSKKGNELLYNSACNSILSNSSVVDSTKGFHLLHFLLSCTIHEFHETCHSVTSHCTGQFTPKMKANAEPRLLSSLV